MNNSKLFQPLTISTMKLRNATFMAPMSLGYESSDGCVNERMQAYWLERARGGVGCIILDALSVDPSVPYLGNTLCFRGEEAIASYKAFTDKVHEAGACIIPQITHPGPESISAFMGIPPVASSVYVNSMGQKTRALAIEELPNIIKQYAQTSLQAKQAARICEVSSVPVLVVGKVLDPAMAMELVDQKAVDGVVFGRALLADPYLVNKAAEDKLEEIAPCTGCVIGCVGEQTKRHPASCVINPACGKELEMKLIPADKKKHVAVAGGGIAGMAAARVLALRGHTVTLFEKTDRLGGQLLLACVPPFKQPISKWVVYLEHELTRLSVDIRLHTEFCENMKDAYDALIVATGATEAVPPIPGLAEHGIGAWEVLKNEQLIPGGNVLVVGGGMVGCEVCEHLLHNKRGPLHITMIEMTDEIAAGMVVNEKVLVMDRLHKAQVQLLTNTRLEAVEAGTVKLNVHGEALKRQDFTHVVYATGSRSNTALACALTDQDYVYVVGDAATVAQALEAVRDATLAAMAV